MSHLPMHLSIQLAARPSSNSWCLDLLRQAHSASASSVKPPLTHVALRGPSCQANTKESHRSPLFSFLSKSPLKLGCRGRGYPSKGRHEGCELQVSGMWEESCHLEFLFSTQREEEIPTMESREFYRNRTNFGWTLGPESDWSCWHYCSVPAPSLAPCPSHSIAPAPRAHSGSCVML